MYITHPSVDSYNVHLELADDVKLQGASPLEVYLHRPSERESAQEFDDITIVGVQLPNGENELGFFERHITSLTQPSSSFIRTRQKQDPLSTFFTPTSPRI